MRTRFMTGKSIVGAAVMVIFGAMLAFALAMAGGVQAAYADEQAGSAPVLSTQASTKALTAKGVYTFSGTYTGKMSITSKATGTETCTKGVLTLKNFQSAWKGANYDTRKMLKGSAYKIKVAKNCAFYSAGSSGLVRKSASEAISQINANQAISLQVHITGKKAKAIYFGAW